MMKYILFVVLLAGLVSCKKDSPKPSIDNVIYPYTKLAGHTWEGISFTDSLTAVPYYQFLDVKSDTAVGVYTATYDGINIIEPEVIYPCKVAIHANHLDSLKIYYYGFPQPTVFFTTKDTTVITDGYINYRKFK